MWISCLTELSELQYVLPMKCLPMPGKKLNIILMCVFLILRSAEHIRNFVRSTIWKYINFPNTLWIEIYNILFYYHLRPDILYNCYVLGNLVSQCRLEWVLWCSRWCQQTVQVCYLLGTPWLETHVRCLSQQVLDWERYLHILLILRQKLSGLRAEFMPPNYLHSVEWQEIKSLWYMMLEY